MTYHISKGENESAELYSLEYKDVPMSRFDGMIAGIRRYIERNPQWIETISFAHQTDSMGVFLNSRLLYQTCGKLYEEMGAKDWLRDSELTTRDFVEAVSLALKELEQSE